LLARAQAQTKD
jgi:hypothetical protein